MAALRIAIDQREQRSPAEARCRILIIAITAMLTGCQPTAPSPLDSQRSSSEGAPSAILFREVTTDWGVSSIATNGEEFNLLTMVEQLGSGGGMLDFDRDGRNDLWFVTGGSFSSEPQPVGRPSQLYRQTRAGHMADVSASARMGAVGHYAHGCAIADYDEDGFADVLVTGYGGLSLWRNLGDGTFAEVTALSGLDGDRSWSSSAGWGDLNGDGCLDLYVAHYVDWSFENDPECPGTGPRRDRCSPKVFQGLDDAVWFSKGDGVFHDASAEAGLVPGGKGLGVLLADLDDDADLDIYVANDTTDNFLYWNDGHGKLRERGVMSGVATDDRGISNGSMGICLLDYDGDELPDLWVANYEDEMFALYRNEGNEQFSYVSDQAAIDALGTLFVGFGTVAGDYDGDGREDIAVSNGHVMRYPANAPVRQFPLVLRNVDGRRFERIGAPDHTYFAAPHFGRGVFQGDLNDDGREDLVFTHINEPAAVLLNETSMNARLLQVRLVGRKSPRAAIGARTTVRYRGGSQTRQVLGGGSYLCASSPVLNFALPMTTGDDATLEVRWPAGNKDQIAIPSGIRLLVLLEGDGAATTAYPATAAPTRQSTPND